MSEQPKVTAAAAEVQSLRKSVAELTKELQERTAEVARLLKENAVLQSKVKGTVGTGGVKNELVK